MSVKITNLEIIGFTLISVEQALAQFLKQYKKIFSSPKYRPQINK